MSDYATVISLTIGVLSFLSGIVLWYKGSVEKRYAAERDFGHIKRNQEQIAQSLAEIWDEVKDGNDAIAGLKDLIRDTKHSTDEMSRSFIEMKAFTAGISNRLEGIAARIDSNTGGWSNRNS